MINANFSYKKIKVLVEGGADINYKFPNGQTPLTNIIDLQCGKDYYKVLEYLIVEKKGIVNQSYYVHQEDDNIDLEFKPVDTLREWVFDLDSDEYKIKKNIIEEFKRQGVDYYATPIPEDTLEYIKKEYPATWQEYIKVY